MFKSFTVLLIVLIFEFSEANKTESWEKSLSKLKDEFNYQLNTTIKIHDIFEKRIEEIVEKFTEFRKEFNNKIRVERNFKHIESEGNWVRYKNMKSFLLINRLNNFNEAKKVCEALEESIESKATLAVIESKDEQNFINRYLYEDLGTVERVWIGMKKEDLKTEFSKDNGTYLKYTNWANGRPSPYEEKSCVCLKSPYSSIDDKPEDNLIGLWEDVSCNNNNLVLCQRMQTWTLSQVQRMLYDMNVKIDKMIPIGFIYSQLPSQPEPQSIWPNFNWTDISEEYSGLFFRVLGNNSSSFNLIQEENSPRLIKVRTRQSGGTYREAEVTASGGYSSDYFTGGTSGDPIQLDLIVSSGEVRPRNQAIRIWKRVQ